MTDRIKLKRQPPRAGTSAARAAAAMTATVVWALLAAACGSASPAAAAPGSSAHMNSAHTAASSSARSAVDYSHCMRAHGVPKYPDPASNGQLPKGTAQTFGVSSSRYQAAERACRHLLPNSDTTFTAALIQCLETGSCPAAVVHKALTEGRKFAQCMRHHGVPNWPDPTIDSRGRPSFQVTKAGISIAATRSRQMLAKIGHCQNETGAESLLREE